MDVLGKPLGDKVMTAREAVERFVSHGATIGMGGQSIGRVGDSGSLKGPHLYFEIRHGQRALDPMQWLR